MADVIEREMRLASTGPANACGEMLHGSPVLFIAGLFRMIGDLVKPAAGRTRAGGTSSRAAGDSDGTGSLLRLAGAVVGFTQRVFEAVDDWLHVNILSESYRPQPEPPRRGTLRWERARQRRIAGALRFWGSAGTTILGAVALLALAGLPAQLVVFLLAPATYILSHISLERFMSWRAPYLFEGSLLGLLLSEQAPGAPGMGLTDTGSIALLRGGTMAMGRGNATVTPPTLGRNAVEGMLAVGQATTAEQADRFLREAENAIDVAATRPDLSPAHREALALVRVYLGVQFLRLASRFRSWQWNDRAIAHLEGLRPGWRMQYQRVESVRRVALARAYWQQWRDAEREQDLQQARKYWNSARGALNARDPNLIWAIDEYRSLTLLLQLTLHDEDISEAEQLRASLEGLMGDDLVARVVGVLAVAVHAAHVTDEFLRGGYTGLGRFVNEDRTRRLASMRAEVEPTVREAWSRAAVIPDGEGGQWTNFISALKEVDFETGTAAGLLMQTLDARAGDPLMQLRELTLEAQVLAEGTPERTGEARRPIEGVRHVIFVASNKGGVGKSTVAANLAVGLAERTGGRVGLLDADVTGPNQPTIFGLQTGMQADMGLSLIEAHGVSLASLGQLLDKSLPVIWRGPMIGTAVRWLLREVPWGELEYLVIDLPPGTSDAAITAAQEVPAVGLIVTTPSMVAVEDAAKMREMYGKFDVEVLGVVENMAHFTCPHCEGHTAIFGQGVEDAAREWGLDVLSTIPIEPGVSAGEAPVVVGNPESPASEAIRGLVETVMSRTSELAESRADGETELSGRTVPPGQP